MVPPVYGATFYPSAATRDQATAIELAAGQTVSGIDIHLTLKRSITVRGGVTGMPAGPEISTYITLFWSEIGTYTFTRPEPDGTFAIAGLTPGKYRLMARLQGSDGPDMQSASKELEVENDDNSIVLALVRAETLSGTVEIEGDAPKSPVREKLGVRLSPEIQFGENKGADVGEDGTFHIDRVFPGKLRMIVMPLPENAYVKSIKAGSAEAQDGLVDLSHGVAGSQIHITLSRNGGRVEGRVLGEDGQPFTGPSMVILTESDDPLDEKGFQAAEAGEKFSYSGLRPGKYRFMALEPSHMMMSSQAKPDALKALLAHAEEIEIHEGDRISKDIKISATK
jgi:hypothetical protein